MALELTRLIAMLVIGGLVGAGLAGYAMQQNRQGTSTISPSTSTNTTTVTQIVVSQVTKVTTTTVTTGASNYYKLSGALNDSYKAKLNVTSYIFLNSESVPDLLIAQIQNIGNASFVVSRYDCLLNDTFYAQTSITPAFAGVIYGQFLYVAPGWSFTVSVKLPLIPSVGDKTTLSIYNNSWIFPFGTARSGTS